VWACFPIAPVSNSDEIANRKTTAVTAKTDKTSAGKTKSRNDFYSIRIKNFLLSHIRCSGRERTTTGQLSFPSWL